MRRAAFCRMPAHSISFSSVMVTEGPEVLTPATSCPTGAIDGHAHAADVGVTLAVVDGIAPAAGDAQFLQNAVQIGDGVGLILGALLRDVREPLLLGHVGQDGLADAGAVKGGGLA